MRRWKAAALVLGIGACGTDEPTGVVLHTGHVRAAGVLIDGTWTALPPDTATRIDVDGPYAVTSVCDDGDPTLQFFDHVTELFALDDGPEQWLPCQQLSDPVTVGFGFTSSNNQVAYISRTSANTSRLYATVERGVYDILALDRVESRYRIYRDFDAHEDAGLAVDFADAPMLEQRAITIDDAPLDPATTSSLISVTLGGDRETRARLVLGPYDRFLRTSDLEAGDRQEVELYKQVDPQNGVHTRVQVGDGPIAARMPPVITDASGSLDGGEPSATWTYERETTRAALSVAQDSAELSAVVIAYAGWLRATGGDTIVGVDVTTMPGWDASWPVPVRVEGVTVTYDDEREGAHRQLSSP